MKKKLHNPVIQLQWDYLQLQTTKKKVSFQERAELHACKHGRMFETNRPLLQSITMQGKLRNIF